MWNIRSFSKNKTDIADLVYYDTDIDSEEYLIACKYSIEEITKMIGADSLEYLPKEKLGGLIGSTDYCNACFDGEYPTPVMANIPKNRFEQKISKSKAE